MYCYNKKEAMVKTMASCFEGGELLGCKPSVQLFLNDAQVLVDLSSLHSL